MKEIKPKRFCSHCGCEMIVIKRGAEENIMFCDGYYIIPIAGAYNKENGLRNYCWYCKCPMYEDKKWYQVGGSPHDRYFIDKVFN